MLARALVALSIAVFASPAVTISAKDGRKIGGTWVAATGASAERKLPAAVLVPDAARGTKDAWNALSKALRDAGVSTLVLESRALASSEAFGVGAMDVTGALGWLRDRRDVDLAHLLVIGANDGAMVALAAACLDLEIAGLAMISPVLDPDRLDDVSALGDWGLRPLFVAVAKGDRRAAKSALVLDGNAKGAKKIHIAEGSRNGIELIAADAKVRDALLAWARQTVAPAEASAP